MDLISIVVPIFNVEQYLSKCIESILRQTYQNIEIILIDDGSTDECGKICDEYKTKDTRIIVVHKKNGGLSDARNAGIVCAKGKYITFIDSDDYVSNDYIDDLYNTLINTGADISIVDMLSVYDGEEERITKNHLNNNIFEYSSEEAILNTLDVRLRQSAWGKLYPKCFFESIKFPVGSIYEDIAVVFYLLMKAKKVSFLGKKDYFYLVRNNSIMTSSFTINQFYSLRNIEEELDCVLSQYPNYSDKIYARKCYDELFVYYRLRKSKKHKEYIDEYKALVKRIASNINKIKNFKNIKKSIRIRMLAFKTGWLFFKIVMAAYEAGIKKKQKRI